MRIGMSEIKKHIIAALTFLTLFLLQTISAYASYGKNYSDVDLLLQDTEFVVYGRVAAADCFGDDGLIWTDVTVEIIDPMESDFSTGDILHIYQQSGELTINEFIQSFEEPMRQYWAEEFSEYTETEKDTNYMRQTGGRPASVVSDEAVYCLTSSAWSTSEKTVYECVGGYCGEYKKVEADLFTVVPPGSNDHLVLQSSAERGYTLEELKTLLRK